MSIDSFPYPLKGFSPPNTLLQNQVPFSWEKIQSVRISKVGGNYPLRIEVRFKGGFLATEQTTHVLATEIIQELNKCMTQEKAHFREGRISCHTMEGRCQRFLHRMFPGLAENPNFLNYGDGRLEIYRVLGNWRIVHEANDGSVDPQFTLKRERPITRRKVGLDLNHSIPLGSGKRFRTASPPLNAT